MAAVLERKDSPGPGSPSDVTVRQSVGVGYESGPGPYGGRTGGWTTAAGVGVGVGEPDPRYPGSTPASRDRDRRAIEMELTYKSLPNGAAAAPVAGYLYFPAPSKKKSSGVYELDYEGAGKMVRLYVPPPPKR